MKNLLNIITMITIPTLLLGCQNLYKTPQQSITVPINLVSAQGIGSNIGHITFSDSAQGLQIKTDLTQIPAGAHGFHIHENPSCLPDVKDGVATAALKAGGHFDPYKTAHHGNPTGDGHLGDLPYLTGQANQTSQEKLIAPRLNLTQIQGKAVMIHAGADNYADTPQPLGGGGARIACGVIK